jgi:hypothetical protein
MRVKPRITLEALGKGTINLPNPNLGSAAGIAVRIAPSFVPEQVDRLSRDNRSIHTTKTLAKFLGWSSSST